VQSLKRPEIKQALPWHWNHGFKFAKYIRKKSRFAINLKTENDGM